MFGRRKRKRDAEPMTIVVGSYDGRQTISRVPLAAARETDRLIADGRRRSAEAEARLREAHERGLDPDLDAMFLRVDEIESAPRRTCYQCGRTLDSYDVGRVVDGHQFCGLPNCIRAYMAEGTR